MALHASEGLYPGWSAKALAGYLRMYSSTVHRVLRRWVLEWVEGLEDRPHGRPPGVRKVTLKAMEAVRRLRRNPKASAPSGSTWRSHRSAPPEPEDLRAHPRHEPRTLRPGQAEGPSEGEEGDALPGREAPPQHRTSDGGGWRRGRLPGSLDTLPSGVDPIEEGEHPSPHRLRRRAIVLGQVGIGEEVTRAGIGVFF